MTIPAFDSRGLLPSGTHQGTWEEINSYFCWNNHRSRLFDRVYHGIQHEITPIAKDLGLYLGGSFLSDKDLPSDIEATLVVSEQHFKLNNITAILGLGSKSMWHHFMHQYALDLYITIEAPGLNDFRLLFQYVGPKSASNNGLHERDPRGILQVIPWANG